MIIPVEPNAPVPKTINLSRLKSLKGLRKNERATHAPVFTKTFSIFNSTDFS